MNTFFSHVKSPGRATHIQRWIWCSYKTEPLTSISTDLKAYPKQVILSGFFVTLNMHCAIGIPSISLLWVLYPKHVSQFQELKKYLFSPKFCLFLHPFYCTHMHRLLWEKTKTKKTKTKKNPVVFFVRASYLHWIEYKCPPPRVKRWYE